MAFVRLTPPYVTAVVSTKLEAVVRKPAETIRILLTLVPTVWFHDIVLTPELAARELAESKAIGILVYREVDCRYTIEPPTDVAVSLNKFSADPEVP